MQTKFTATSILTTIQQDGKTKLKNTQITLDMSKHLDSKMYFDQEHFPNKDGAKVLSNAFVQGLLANIHASHQKGHWDSAEHLRWIISELERGFIKQVNVQVSELDTQS